MDDKEAAALKPAIVADFSVQAGAGKRYNSEVRPRRRSGSAPNPPHGEMSFLEGADVCPQAQTEREGTHSERKIRCVLAHEHVLLRQGLRRLLEDDDLIEVTAEAESAAEALAMVSGQRPDIVITDADTFGCTAYEAEQLILQESPHSKILFLIARGDYEAHDNRVRSLPRQTPTEELIEMLKRMVLIDKAVLREMPRRSREDWPAGSYS